MFIADATARALENVAARERELTGVFPQMQSLPPAGEYFITRDETGRQLFTRSDALFLRDGTMTDANGREILGFRTPGSALSPLRADPVDLALGITAEAQINADGTVSYARQTIDPRNGERRLQYTSLGRLAVARFPAGTRLTAGDGSYSAAPAGVAPHIGVPGDGNFAPLGQEPPGARNGDLDLGLQRLQEAYLALDALRAASTAQGSVQKTAMDLLK